MDLQPATTASYELDFAIGANAGQLWRALVEQTNEWWPAEYHLVAADSIIAFRTEPGGGLIETAGDGSSLIWYSIQFFQPQERTMFLVGHIAPDWGGPSLSQLKLQVVDEGDAARLHLTDSLIGNVSEASIQSLMDGWNQLLGRGLKEFLEQ